MWNIEIVDEECWRWRINQRSNDEHILIFNLHMNNKFVNNNYKSEGFRMHRSKDGMVRVLAKSTKVFAQSSKVFAQSSKLLA